VGIELERDGFERENPIVVNKNRDRIEFVLENRTADRHQTRIKLDVIGSENWILKLDKKIVQPQLRNGKVVFNIDVIHSEHKVLLEKSK
jgi:hypothetical protein